MIGYQQAVVSVGVTAADEDAWPEYDMQVIEPGRVTNDVPPPPALEDEPPWLGPGVHPQVVAPDDGDVQVQLRAKRALLEAMPHRFVAEEHAKLRGEDTEAAAEAWYAQRETRGTQAVHLLTQLVESLDGEVLDVDLRVGSVHASLPAHALGQLAADTRLAAVSMHRDDGQMPNDTAAGYWTNVYGNTLDGVEIESVLQSRQFYLAGYHALGEQLGLTEPAGDDLRRSHPGFTYATGGARVENRKWNSFYWSNPNPSIGGPHSTATATVMVGDITQGQDPTITSAVQRRRRSGVARAAYLLGMTSSSRTRLVSQMTSPSRTIQVVNLSAGYPNTDPLCEGRDDWSRTANELFESGVVLVKSAGNEGHVDDDDCKLTSPGAAIGAFTVGAYWVEDDGSGTLDYTGQSRGGTSTEGRGRTAVAVSAPTNFLYPYPRRGDCSFDYGGYWHGNDACPSSPPAGGFYSATSGSTPMVAGGYALVHSHYRTVYPSPTPGAIHALLLLMGDRRDEAGGFMTSGYDGLWGAGRLRLRRYDAEGLDGPLRWTLGSTCVSHGQSLIIPVTTADVNSDVDVMKAVSYVYDSRHDDSSTPSDRVRLSLMRELMSGVWVEVEDDDSTDNKKRVFVYGPTPGRYAIRLQGTQVSGSGEGGCGTNQTRVWYSYMHEDSDREAHEDLDTVRPEDEDVP